MNEFKEQMNDNKFRIKYFPNCSLDEKETIFRLIAFVLDTELSPMRIISCESVNPWFHIGDDLVCLLIEDCSKLHILQLA